MPIIRSSANTSSIQYCSHHAIAKGNVFTKESMLIFVLEGRYDLHYGDIKYNLGERQIAFIKKDTWFEYRSIHAKGVVLVFEITTDLVVEFAKLTRLNHQGNGLPSTITVNDPSSQLLAYISALQVYFQQGNAIAAELAKIKLMELLYCVSMHDRPVLMQLLNMQGCFRSNITHIVEENMLNSLSLEQLARLAGRSVSSLRRDFLSIYNMPPSRWIRQKKLEKARELLMNTNMTVTDICYTLGFENVAHFSRIFKSHFKCSPSGLRTAALAV